jgi:phosphoglucomutase
MNSAGTPAIPAILTNIPRLVTAYYADVPDLSIPRHPVLAGVWLIPHRRDPLA